jgi:hypothetical protein
VRMNQDMRVNYFKFLTFFRDLEFFPNSIYKFATCGQQHMAVWTFKGSTFSYYNLEIANPKDLVEMKMRDDDEDMDEEEMNLRERKGEENLLKVTFMCLVFVNEAKITGGDDGFVYKNEILNIY